MARRRNDDHVVGFRKRIGLVGDVEMPGFRDLDVLTVQTLEGRRQFIIDGLHNGRHGDTLNVIDLITCQPLIGKGSLSAERAEVRVNGILLFRLFIGWPVVPFELSEAVRAFTPKKAVAVQRYGHWDVHSISTHEFFLIDRHTVCCAPAQLDHEVRPFHLA